MHLLLWQNSVFYGPQNKGSTLGDTNIWIMSLLGTLKVFVPWSNSLENIQEG